MLQDGLKKLETNMRKENLKEKKKHIHTLFLLFFLKYVCKIKASRQNIGWVNEEAS